MSFFHKVAAVSGITAGQIVSVKASMNAEKTFLYLGLPTVNQILYQADVDKLPSDSLISQAWRWAASVPGHLVRQIHSAAGTRPRGPAFLPLCF